MFWLWPYFINYNLLTIRIRQGMLADGDQETCFFCHSAYLWNILLPIRMALSLLAFQKALKTWQCTSPGNLRVWRATFPSVVMLTLTDYNISWLLFVFNIFLVLCFIHFNCFYDCSLPRITDLKWAAYKLNKQINNSWLLWKFSG